MIFAEHKKGYDSSLLYARHFLSGRINNKLPLIGPPDVSYWDNRDNDVYNKGAMVLNTIRNVLNDSTLFFHILRTFYIEHAGASHVTSADFIEVVERETGKDWDKFFEAYLYSREVPVLKWYPGSYDTGQDPDSNAIKGAPFVVAKWTNVPAGFSMPVRLDFKNGNPPVTIEVTTTPTQFYLKDMSSSNQLICNKRLSYFSTVTDKSVLEEISLNTMITTGED